MDLEAAAKGLQQKRNASALEQLNLEVVNESQKTTTGAPTTTNAAPNSPSNPTGEDQSLEVLAAGYDTILDVGSQTTQGLARGALNTPINMANLAAGAMNPGGYVQDMLFGSHNVPQIPEFEFGRGTARTTLGALAGNIAEFIPAFALGNTMWTKLSPVVGDAAAAKYIQSFPYKSAWAAAKSRDMTALGANPLTQNILSGVLADVVQQQPDEDTMTEMLSGWVGHDIRPFLEGKSGMTKKLISAIEGGTMGTVAFAVRDLFRIGKARYQAGKGIKSADPLEDVLSDTLLREGISEDEMKIAGDAADPRAWVADPTEADWAQTVVDAHEQMANGPLKPWVLASRFHSQRVVTEFREAFRLDDGQAKQLETLLNNHALWFAQMTGRHPEEYFARFKEVAYATGDPFKALAERSTWLAQSSARITLDESPLVVTGTGKKGKILVHDVGVALNAKTLEDYGDKVYPYHTDLPFRGTGQTAEAMVKKGQIAADAVMTPTEIKAVAKQAINEELDARLASIGEGQWVGRGWYTEDLETAKIGLRVLRPETEDPAIMEGMTHILGALSPGIDPEANLNFALRMFDEWKETGFGHMPLKSETLGPFHMYPKTAAEQATKMNAIFDQEGSWPAAFKWFSELHPAKELNKLFGNIEDIKGGRPDRYGWEIMGPKAGAFIADMHGKDELVVDLWFTRAWRRYFGAGMEFDPEKARLTLTGEPRGIERRLMRQTVEEVASERGWDVKDVQAVMWYYEQNLYSKLGVESEALSYGGAVQKLLEKNSDEIEASVNAVRKVTSRTRAAATGKRGTGQAHEGGGGAFDATLAAAKESDSLPEGIKAKDLITPTPSPRPTYAGMERGTPLAQQNETIRGLYEFDQGQHVIHAFDGADFSTAVHEVGHALRRDIAEVDPEGMARIAKWAGVGPDGVWAVEHEELFTRALERYWRDGKTPHPEMQSTFDAIAGWMRRTYRTIRNSPIDVKLSKETRDYFDNIYKYNPATDSFGALPKAVLSPAELETTEVFVSTNVIEESLPPTRVLELSRDMSVRASYVRLGQIGREVATLSEGKFRVDSHTMGYGMWEAGGQAGEPTSVFHLTYPKGTDPAEIGKWVDYAAARFGEAGQQKAVLSFRALTEGPDVMFQAEIPIAASDPNALKLMAQLKTDGIPNFTLIPAGDRYILNIADEKAVNVKRISEYLHGKEGWTFDYWRGHSKLHGTYDGSREAAVAAHGQVGRAFEASRGIERTNPGQNGGALRLDSSSTLSPGERPVYFNFARINSEEDLDGFLRNWMESDADGINATRGGAVRSDADLEKLADASGIGLVDLLKRDAQIPFTDLEVKKFRSLHLALARQVQILSNHAARDGATKADLFAFEKGRAIFAAANRKLIAGRTATARSLRVWAQMADATDYQRAKIIDDLLRDSGGSETVAELAKRLSAATSPEQLAKGLAAADKYGPTDLFKAIWINGLLSNPKTHIRNVVGNTVALMWELADRSIAAGVPMSGVEKGEALAMLYGQIKSVRSGVVAAGKALFGVVPEGATKIEVAHSVDAARAFNLSEDGIAGASAYWIGEAAQAPSKLLVASDTFFKTVASSGETHALAWRQAAKEGLSGTAFAERLAELIAEPTDEIVNAAWDAARRLTFTDKLGPRAGRVSSGLHAIPGSWLIVPFFRTPLKLWNFAYHHTPLAVVHGELRKEMFSGDPVRRSKAIAQVATGTGIMITIADMVHERSMNGYGPSNPSERAAWLRDGNLPYSMKLSVEQAAKLGLTIDRPQSIQFSGADPVGLLMGMAADTAEVVSHMNEEDSAEQVAASTLLMSKSLTERSYVSGMVQFLAAWNNPDMYGMNYLSRMVGTLIPYSSLSRELTGYFDPIMRDTKSVSTPEKPVALENVLPVGAAEFVQQLLNSARVSIPGAQADLPPAHDLFGNELSKRSSLGPEYDALSPFKARANKNDPVEALMMKNRPEVGMPERSIMGVELTAEEYEDYIVMSGKPLHEWIAKRVEKISSMPQGQGSMASELLAHAALKFRQKGRAQLLKKYPDIKGRIEHQQMKDQAALRGVHP